MRCDRRNFLALCVGMGSACWVRDLPAAPAGQQGRQWEEATPESGSAPARYWEGHEDGTVRCKLEPRECHVAPGERGFCGARENRDGKYFSVVYGQPCVVEVGPVEREFYHVLPGTRTLMLGTAGCNLHCNFCNTYHISQRRPEEVETISMSPRQVVARAKDEGCASICFTFNDPVVCIEFVMDTARLARKAGLKVLCHTAGMIHPEPLNDLAGLVDAFNVDLKSLSERVYKEWCEVPLAPVLATLKQLAAHEGTFLEVTTLLLPTVNESPEFVTQSAQWLIDNTGPDTPWQVSRFFPSYRLTRTHATSMSVLRDTVEKAREVGLHYVYTRNTAADATHDVRCGECGEVVVHRRRDGEPEVRLRGGRCHRCDHLVPGVWM